jgi:hypothetical protein
MFTVFLPYSEDKNRVYGSKKSVLVQKPTTIGIFFIYIELIAFSDLIFHTFIKTKLIYCLL